MLSNRTNVTNSHAGGASSSVRGSGAISYSRQGCGVGYVLGLLIASNLLVFQLSGMYRVSMGGSSLDPSMIFGVVPPSGGLGGLGGGERHPMLDVPRGLAVALPSVRVAAPEQEEDPVAAAAAATRGEYYGGKGDKNHLGGFANKGIDMEGVSPAAWKWMVHRHGIHTLLDVGCGRGISTAWFQAHGVDANCVEGSHDAIEQTVLDSPALRVTEHDFSRGPWWPPRTVDAVWCVELLEHVSRNFHTNLMPTFRSAALVYATHSHWGGWHHVEIHSTDWWIARFQSYGFVYSQYLTDEIRGAAISHKDDPTPNGGTYSATHLWSTMMVFINPTVASLPEHSHLLSENGCYNMNREQGNRRCGNVTDIPPDEKEALKRLESTLPPHYESLPLTDEMDAEWEMLVFGATNVTVAASA
jgi:Methyltransferase domain